MPHIDEHQAVQLVGERLAARFPGVPPATVRTIVEEAHAKLVGPVRDFIPVLVEHAAKERLVTMARSETLHPVS